MFLFSPSFYSFCLTGAKVQKIFEKQVGKSKKNSEELGKTRFEENKCIIFAVSKETKAVRRLELNETKYLF